MSYQLPDLLSLLASFAGDDDDGDLHINSSYQHVSDISLSWILGHLRHSEDLAMTKNSRLQKTTREFLKEYNPGLLASTYFPFSSAAKSATVPSILQVATEWMGICALVAEETLRPHRIIDFEGLSPVSPSEATQPVQPLADLLVQSPWQCIVHHLSYFNSASSEALQDLIQKLLNAHFHPPPKPNPSRLSPAPVTEYLEWRITMSGHRILSELFLSSEKRVRFRRSLALALEIIACVTELFAFNIHQAWHSRSKSDRSHLNLIAFLLAADAELTLQGAVNLVGAMIRERIMQLRDDLETHKRPSTITGAAKGSGGMLTSLFPSFFIRKAASSPANIDAAPDTDATQDLPDDSEIRRTLLNWVMGTIHWAYEVEYFFPNLEDNEQHQSGPRRKRGGEIRDYGWIFLIKGQDIGES